MIALRGDLQLTDIPLKNFPAHLRIRAAGTRLKKLSFPPALQMLDYIQRELFMELVISMPGPVVLTVLLAVEMLGLRTSGIYYMNFLNTSVFSLRNDSLKAWRGAT